MSILCAVDFSPPSAVALTCAARIATRFAQPLTVLTVADPLLVAAERLQTRGDPVALLTRALTDFVDETLGAGAAGRHRTMVAMGEPSVEIRRAADGGSAQLLVIATQGASGVKKFMFGSVADRVLRAATQPVLVVPPTVAAGPMRTIGDLQEVLMPVDFHAHALEDAQVACRVARASHARLRLLHVTPSDDAGRWTVLRARVAPQLADELDGPRLSQVEKARGALQRLAGALDLSPAPEIEVERGPVADRIAEVAGRADVDLVVLGLRGAAGVFSARVGAVAYRVVCVSPALVLALPHETRAARVLGFLG